MPNAHAELARWLLERARAIHGDIAESAAEVAKAERFMAPAHLDGIKAELEKATDLAIHLADASAAITELTGRLDDTLERLSDVITTEALLKQLERFGIDGVFELLTLVHDVTSGNASPDVADDTSSAGEVDG